MVTGLYAESHGILNNLMFDPILNASFGYQTLRRADPDELSSWFRQNKRAEPVWITNVKAGGFRRSAVYWIAGDCPFDNLTNAQNYMFIPYNETRSFESLIDSFIQMFIDKERPINFGALYFNQPDWTGHSVGTSESSLRSTFEMLDNAIGHLIDALKANNLFDQVNLIVTSDHGMVGANTSTVTFLSEHIDMSLFDAYGSPALYMLYFRATTTANNQTREQNIQLVYAKLKKLPNIDTFRANEIPEEFHFRQNRRVGDILIVAKLTHIIALDKSQFSFSGHSKYYFLS